MMHFLPIRIFSRYVCGRRRSGAGPRGWVFLRNYKRLHRDRITRAIQQAALGPNLWIGEKAFDESGQQLPQKIAIYAQSQDAASLFFQFYAQTKAQEARGKPANLSSTAKRSTV